MAGSGARVHIISPPHYRCCLLGLVIMSSAACESPVPDLIQGYVEGEFIYVSSPLPGTLVTLSVAKGDEVQAGDPLFELDDTTEQAALAEAQERLTQARATLADTRKGRRAPEIESLEAQLKQARTSLEFSEKELLRQAELLKTDTGTQQSYDNALSRRNQDRDRVTQLEADLKTAGLGSRSDQIAAAEAEVRAREAAVTTAEWNLDQKHQSAPQAGAIYDVLYREGEWVAAGRPVVALLPPRNRKVRAFVPETLIGGVHVGDSVRVTVDGAEEPFTGEISFVSPRAEYTPPVIYSRESRAKLVFMIEATFPSKIAEKLHPGQPVDVELRLDDEQ